MTNPFKKLTPYEQFLRDNPSLIGFSDPGPHNSTQIYRKSDANEVGTFFYPPTGYRPNLSSGLNIHPSGYPNGLPPDGQFNSDWWKLK